MPVDFKGKFRFSSENRFAIGVEEEVWIVHPRTGVLLPWATKIFTPGYEKRYPMLKPELPSQQIEAVTPICRSMAEVQHALIINDATLHLLARQHGFRVSREPVPTKPFSVNVFPTSRYLQIQKRVGERLRGAYVAGLHIHIGVGSPDEAVRAINVLRQYLPEFLSLSACSPRTVEGRRYVSFRFIKYCEMAGGIVPRHFRHWEDFETAALSEGFYEDPRNCWWAVRISPHGTVELRVCDVQPNRASTLALVAMARVLVRAAIEGGIATGDPVPSDVIAGRLLEAARGQCGSMPLILIANDLAMRLGAKEEGGLIRRLLE
jgi:carboxylate-amine ligase